MQILITGAHGQLGSELERMLAAGRSALGGLPACYAGARVTAVDLDTLDIADAKAVEGAVGAGTDLVINCAAYTNVNGCEKEQALAFKANVLGARNVARAAEACGAKVVHVSTDYVFPGDAREPYVEWDACGPRSVYGKSKLLGEGYVRDFSTRYFIVRTAWLYGLTGGNFVKTMLRVGRQQGEVEVVDDQRGNPTNAHDLAYHILKLAATEEYGIYHCTGSGECSWFEFTRKIMEYAGVPCAVRPCTTQDYMRKFPGTAPRPAYSALENRMLRCTVGDEMRPWQEALQSYIQDLRAQEQ